MTLPLPPPEPSPAGTRVRPDVLNWPPTWPDLRPWPLHTSPRPRRPGPRAPAPPSPGSSCPAGSSGSCVTCCRADTGSPAGALSPAIPDSADPRGASAGTWGGRAAPHLLSGSARQPPHPVLPGARGFPGLRTFSDRTWKVLGQRGHLVTPSPRPHPEPEKLQLAQARGLEEAMPVERPQRGLDRRLWLLRLQASPRYLQRHKVQTRGPIPVPGLVGPLHPLFGPPGHKTDAGEGQGSPKMRWESWCLD